MEPHQEMPKKPLSKLAETLQKKNFFPIFLPQILPMDLRRLAPLETNGNYEENGGESTADGAFPADDFGRKNIRGEVPGVDSDAGFVHVVGVCAADEVVPGKTAGFGADV